MDDVVASDPRVAAILTRPQDYFDRARARAWLAAGHDIRADVGRRESRRRDRRSARPVDEDRR